MASDDIVARLRGAERGDGLRHCHAAADEIERLRTELSQAEERKDFWTDADEVVHLGAALARAEQQEALPLMAQRMKNLRIDGTVTWKPSTVAIFGPENMPISFDAE